MKAFTFTAEDLRHGAEALREARDENPPSDELPSTIANAEADVEAVLIRLGGAPS